MKIRRLPEIDLARIAPLSVDEKRRQLERHKAGRPPFSYDPLRHTIHDLINVTPDLFEPTEPTPWAKVAQLIWRRAKSEDEYKSNLTVAQSLHAYSIQSPKACTLIRSSQGFERGSRKSGRSP